MNRVATGDNGSIGIASLAKESDLWPRRDEAAVRAELASRFLAFAKSIAMRYRGKAETVDDLVQVASIGLMNAITRFDPDKGVPFLAFASPTIHGELKRHFRDRVSIMRVPRAVYDRIGQMDSVIADLRSSLAHEPGISEIAEAMGCSDTEVLDARGASQTRNPISLRSGEDEEEGVIEEHLGAVDEGFEKSEDLIVTREALTHLSNGDRRIIQLRFHEELTQSQIAAQIGCSQMQVSRRIRSILQDMNDTVLAA